MPNKISQCRIYTSRLWQLWWRWMGHRRLFWRKKHLWSFGRWNLASKQCKIQFMFDSSCAIYLVEKCLNIRSSKIKVNSKNAKMDSAKFLLKSCIVKINSAKFVSYSRVANVFSSKLAISGSSVRKNFSP